MKQFFTAIQSLNAASLLLAYHDRSDGGVLTTLCEMAFTGRLGLDIFVPDSRQLMPFLFSEELGAVIQIRRRDRTAVQAVLDAQQLGDCTQLIALKRADKEICIHHRGILVYRNSLSALLHCWWETSYRIQRLRDNPACADQEFAKVCADDDPGLNAHITYSLNENIAAVSINRGTRPRVAILREQGVSGQIEMAAAFDRTGFSAIDVHMSDIIGGHVSLDTFCGLVACGGFSYGDVLGGGGGWAATILHNARAHDEFAQFFARDDVFGLGVCNGCQTFARLRELIPGAEHWPLFKSNLSAQYEARFSLVEVLESNSILLRDMVGSRIPITVAHGEGRAVFANQQAQAQAVVALRFIDNGGAVAQSYPANPNGSPGGITGLCNTDGRFTIMMPHPERVFRSVLNSWYPYSWPEDGPWMRLFHNARAWV